MMKFPQFEGDLIHPDGLDPIEKIEVKEYRPGRYLVIITHPINCDASATLMGPRWGRSSDYSKVVRDCEQKYPGHRIVCDDGPYVGRDMREVIKTEERLACCFINRLSVGDPREYFMIMDPALNQDQIHKLIVDYLRTTRGSGDHVELVDLLNASAWEKIRNYRTPPWEITATL